MAVVVSVPRNAFANISVPRISTCTSILARVALAVADVYKVKYILQAKYEVAVT